MEIKVGCLTYKVEEMSPELAAAINIYGDVLHQTQTIRLQSDMSEERRKEVILHELIHTVFHQWVPDSVPWNEEMLTTHIAYGLTTVFKDNPHLKEMLF